MTVKTIPLLFLLLGTAFCPSPARGFVILNATRSQSLFDDNFERGTPGLVPGSANPLLGTWSHNGQAIVTVGNVLTDNISPAEGSNFLKVARGEYPKLTARGEANAALNSRPGDLIRIKFAVRVERGVGSIYPITTNHDVAQISFFSDGRVAVVNAAGTTLQYLTQRLTPLVWNTVFLEYINGSGEWSVSVNGAGFEKRAGGSSADLQSGGLVTGLRIQTDAPDTLAWFDHLPDPPGLQYQRSGKQIVLTWSAPGFQLEENFDPADRQCWTAVAAGASSPVTVATEDKAKFFRLRYAGTGTPNPTPWSAYISTGDNQWVSELLPVDSPQSIEAFFEVLARTYGVRRVYWRGEQDRMWLRYFQARPENPRYYDFITGWLTHLNDQVGTNERALAAARRQGMEIYIFDGLFEHGSQGDTGGCGLFPWQAEDRLRLEHPEWRPIDRWGERAAPGPIEFCYPEARQALVQRYLYHVTYHGYDGIAFYTYVENLGFRYADEFGFNEPIVSEFQRRYGVDMRTQPFDKQAWYRLRGEYVTEFLRELQAALSAQGKKLAVAIALRSDGSSFPQPWFAGTGNVPTAGYIHMDWERWVNENLVDELIVYWPGDFDPQPLLASLLAVCTNKPVKLSVMVNRTAPSFPLWSPFMAAGLTPIVNLGNVGVDRFSRDSTSLESLQCPDWRVRAQALADIAAGTLAADTQALAPLRWDDNVLVRRQLMLILGRRQALDQLPILEAGLYDPESSVRIAAANALAEVNGPQTPLRLLNALTNDGEFQMKDACVKALAGMNTNAQAALLVNVTNANRVVREVCARALAQNGLPTSLPALRAALRSDSDDRVRFFAVSGLSSYALPEAGDALLEALDDPASAVQMAAAAALGTRAPLYNNQQQQEALIALDVLFRKFGDGCTRSDAAWGWRVIGNALAAFGVPGKDRLEAMRTQTPDRWLAWAAYQVLYVVQSANQVELVDEASALETHRLYAPPFPGYR